MDIVIDWSYSKNPASSLKDEVRFLVGDTREDEPLVTNAEINYALVRTSNNAYAAAVIIAEAIHTLFSTYADAEEIGPIKVTLNNRVKYYANKVQELKIKAGTASGMSVYGGGIEIADKVMHEEDTSLVRPVFAIGMNDFVATSGIEGEKS